MKRPDEIISYNGPEWGIIAAAVISWLFTASALGLIVQIALTIWAVRAGWNRWGKRWKDKDKNNEEENL